MASLFFKLSCQFFVFLVHMQMHNNALGSEQSFEVNNHAQSYYSYRQHLSPQPMLYNANTIHIMVIDPDRICQRYHLRIAYGQLQSLTAFLRNSFLLQKWIRSRGSQIWSGKYMLFMTLFIKCYKNICTDRSHSLLLNLSIRMLACFLIHKYTSILQLRQICKSHLPLQKLSTQQG